MIDSLISKIAENGAMGLMAAIFIVIAWMLYKSMVKQTEKSNAECHENAKQRELEWRESNKEMKAELRRAITEFKTYEKEDHKMLINCVESANKCIESATKSIQQNTKLMESINKHLNQLDK